MNLSLLMLLPPKPSNKSDAPANPWINWSHSPALSLLSYILLTGFTDAYFFGDTADYARSILDHSDFWDFGHLLWRPFGWLCYHLFGSLTRPYAGSYERTNATLILLVLNWIVGLLSVLVLHSLLQRVCQQEWVINTVLIFFICAQAFLNYTQTGSAYVPGLLLLLLGFYFSLLSGEGKERSLPFSLATGLALAGASCFWLPYTLAIPAALTAPYFLSDNKPTQRRGTLYATGILVLTTVGMYIAVIVLLKLHNLAEVRAWIASSSHGIPASKSLVRMLFGFARSFINMGNDGVLFKRFLLHDPLNPVSLSALVRLSVWKLLLFYLFIASLVIALLRSMTGKRILGLLAVNAVPVIIFAVFWQGGDMERYLALYPALFMALAYALGQSQTPRWLKMIALLFIAMTIITNVGVMAKPNLHRQEAATAARIVSLQPHLKPHSFITVTHLQDDLINFNFSHPFNPINQDSRIHLYALVPVGNSDAPQWRQNLARRTFAAWRQGGDVWLSRRVLSPRPQPQWNWVEGDDKNVKWADIRKFFAPLQFGPTIGDDGFVLLPASPHNKQLLQPFIKPSGHTF